MAGTIGTGYARTYPIGAARHGMSPASGRAHCQKTHGLPCGKSPPTDLRIDPCARLADFSLLIARLSRSTVKRGNA